MSGPTGPDPHRWEEVERWLFRANDDIHLVDAILKLSSPSLGASLRCRRAAEKMAKAVLIAHGARPPHIHDVDQLGHLVSAVNAEIGAEVQALAQLTTWHVAARCPDVATDSLPSIEDLHSSLTKLRALDRPIRALAPPSQ